MLRCYDECPMPPLFRSSRVFLLFLTVCVQYSIKYMQSTRSLFLCLKTCKEEHNTSKYSSDEHASVTCEATSCQWRGHRRASPLASHARILTWFAFLPKDFQNRDTACSLSTIYIYNYGGWLSETGCLFRLCVCLFYIFFCQTKFIF